MTEGRLPSGLLVTALLRRVNDAGGLGMVRAKGDAQAGAILILAETPEGMRALERGMTADGTVGLVESPIADDAESYWRRRRARDPDLWVIELNIPEVQRLVAETIFDG